MNQSWKNYRFAVVDLEGTGAQDKESEAILDIASVKIVNGEVQEENHFYTMINPSRPIPRRPWISIKNEDVKDAPTFDEIQKELLHFFDDCILIAHNAKVDWRLLSRKYPNYHPVLLDTLAMSRKLYLSEKRHSLDHLIERFQITSALFKNEHQRHRAFFDAVMTAHAFVYMMKDKFNDGTTLAELKQICAIETKPKLERNDSDLPTQGSLF